MILWYQSVLTPPCPFLPMRITLRSSSDSQLLPTGGLTHWSFLFIFSPFSCLYFSLCFSGTTSRIRDIGSLWLLLSGFPRTPLSRPNSLSWAGRTTIAWLWSWAGGHGDSECRLHGGVLPWKHLSVDHHVQSPPGSLCVGECYTHFCKHGIKQPKSRFLGSTEWIFYFFWRRFCHSLQCPASLPHLWAILKICSEMLL